MRRYYRPLGSSSMMIRMMHSLVLRKLSRKDKKRISRRQRIHRKWIVRLYGDHGRRMELAHLLNNPERMRMKYQANSIYGKYLAKSSYEKVD